MATSQRCKTESCSQKTYEVYCLRCTNGFHYCLIAYNDFITCGLRLECVQVFAKEPTLCRFLNSERTCLNAHYEPFLLSNCIAVTEIVSPIDISYSEAVTFITLDVFRFRTHEVLKCLPEFLSKNALHRLHVFLYPGPKEYVQKVLKLKTFLEIGQDIIGFGCMYYYLNMVPPGNRLTISQEINDETWLSSAHFGSNLEKYFILSFRAWNKKYAECTLCMEAISPEDTTLHFCSCFKHTLCENCFVQLFHSKLPNLHARRCISTCKGNFAIANVSKKLKPAWLLKYERSIVMQVVALAYCACCMQEAERDETSILHHCPYCVKITCLACFQQFSQGHMCNNVSGGQEDLKSENAKKTDVEQDILVGIIKCAKCGILGMLEPGACNKAYCAACGHFTCACCLQSITNYFHFCRSFASDPVCSKTNCKHCYCWSSLQIAQKTASPEFLRHHKHLDFRDKNSE
jgi:hypothetical protein